MAGTFRDRFLTPQTARAITSPGAILSAGAGASVVILAGAPVAAAAAVGALAYAGVVAWRMPRDVDGERIDPRALHDPWRRFVLEALDAQQRFARAVRHAPAGPLKARLESIGARLATGVRECWRIARHGQALEEALGQLEPVGEVQRRLAQVNADLTGPRAGDERLSQMAEALRSQIASTSRITEVAHDTRDRLRLLDARMDEAVARAVELSLSTSSGDEGVVGGLGSDVDDLVSEMESLRLALEEASHPRAAPGV